MNGFQSLGIDLYSLAVYLVNFGIIVFIVGKYLTGPIITMLDKRSSLIKGNLTEADKLKEEMLAQKSLLEAEQARVREEMNEEMRLLKLDLDNKKKLAEKEIEEKRTQMMDELNKNIEEQKLQMEGNLKKDIMVTVQNMVSYIVSNKIPEKVLEESVEEAWKVYKK